MYSDTIKNLVDQHLNIPNFGLVLNSEWSSSALLGRQSIRKYLFEKLCGSESVLDLEMIPRLPNCTISISHNKRLGGFGIAGKNVSLGFDIELSGRVSDKSLKQVCEETSELRIAPNPTALWAAKEAAYKALLGSQPRGVKDIAIGAWQKLTTNSYMCSITRLSKRSAPQSRGIVYFDELHTLAVFTIAPIELVH